MKIRRGTNTAGRCAALPATQYPSAPLGMTALKKQTVIPKARFLRRGTSRELGSVWEDNRIAAPEATFVLTTFVLTRLLG